MSNLNVTSSAITHIEKIRAQKANPALKLRITVEGGGCSGFQYIFGWDDQIRADDKIYADAIVTDDVSLPFMEGATIDYVVNLMGEDFRIENPNATAGCGCGTSFAV